MADPPSQDSNTRLANVFEMIVSRLDTIESKLDQQNLAVRYNDTEKPRGEAFSALPWTGHCLELRVFACFGLSGELINNMSPGNIIVIGCVQSPSPGDDGYSTLCDTFPGVFAVGQFSIAMTECRTIQTAVMTAVNMARRFKHDPPTHLSLHVISETFAPLAVAIIRGCGEREAFAALPRESRENLNWGDSDFFDMHMHNGIPMRD